MTIHQGSMCIIVVCVSVYVAYVSVLVFLSSKALDKYGDIYGRERIAELLGMDLAELDVSTQQEKKPEPVTSMFSG